MASTRIFRAVALVSLLSSVYAQERTSVEEQSAITDPVEQCRPYNYPPMEGQAANFPPVWETARIVANDEVARAKWDEISPGIPNIASKGNITETFETYNVQSDPDCWWTATECTKPKVEGLPEDLSMVPPPQTLGYGFDDGPNFSPRIVSVAHYLLLGPNCSHNAFYDYLTSQNQKASQSSSLLAERAITDTRGYPKPCSSLEVMFISGLCKRNEHLKMVMNSVSTPGLTNLMQVIKLVAGVTPTCFRPPLGDTDDRIRYISDSLGLRTVLWQYDTRDTIPGPSGVVDFDQVEKNYQDFLTVARSGTFQNEGAILLAHETNNQTMELAVKYYPQLKEAFKYIVPVAVALNNTQPYVETDYSMPTFEQYIGGITQTDGPASENPSTTTNTRTTSRPTSSTTPSGSTGNSENGASSLISSAFFALPVFFALLL
ncbi:hypothetical protein VNI00_009369 [Paramarasmius palmivorus]|uniref:Chitin deacetylase n=1 Tax=Paramarasmius palmivorus TaxID=297713 RepID=A0AAW0CR52_9AGAR